MSAWARVAQGLSAFSIRVPADLDIVLNSHLDAEQQIAFRLLSRYDQVHLINAARWLESRGHCDSDLLQAALLHDLGKAALGGRVRLVDRVAAVLLARTPQLRDRLAKLPASRWRLGLVCAVHHPELGAQWAAELGCSPRVCWLIARHADDPLPDDAELRLLAIADRSV